jgi:ABC-2 type transport system permease protein
VKLFVAIVSLSVRRAIAFRANLVAEALVSLVNVVASLVILRSISAVAGTLGGWSHDELTILIGFYLIASGLLWACVEPNLGWFREQVLKGHLDEILLSPVSGLFLATLGSCSPLALGQSIAGIVVLAIGVNKRQELPSISNLLAALGLFLTGWLCIWSVKVILASLTFWAPSLQPDVGFRAMWEFGRYPVTIYARPVRLLFTYAVPIAVIATLPTNALTGSLTWEAAAGAVTVSAVALGIARSVWTAGLRRYTSATS